mmetsp:Transcript_15006/g.21033  ORF Transcript_15006/g.21033 Transcript_15006/m.21033 type:complete len:131 (-) Transcript_15006:287-679(-)
MKSRRRYCDIFIPALHCNSLRNILTVKLFEAKMMQIELGTSIFYGWRSGYSCTESLFIQKKRSSAGFPCKRGFKLKAHHQIKDLLYQFPVSETGKFNVSEFLGRCVSPHEREIKGICLSPSAKLEVDADV